MPRKSKLKKPDGKTATGKITKVYTVDAEGKERLVYETPLRVILKTSHGGSMVVSSAGNTIAVCNGIGLQTGGGIINHFGC